MRCTTIMVIALLVLKLESENMWASLMILMDANLAPRLQLEIQEKVNQIYGVKGKSEVKMRQAGPFRLAECIIATKPSLSICQAHELADKVEDSITKTYPDIESVLIHVEPVKEAVMAAIFPVCEIKCLDSRLHGHFARAPYFLILTLRGEDSRIPCRRR